jgi:hypothetical protein
VLNPQFFRNADKVRYLKHRIRRIIFQRNIFRLVESEPWAKLRPNSGNFC